MIVPKLLHAIWLGGILDQVGRNNICRWSFINPDYVMNLWIDSALFTEKQKAEFPSFAEWARQNKVVLRDLNGADKKTYTHMLMQKFYDDEVSGMHRNYAAASDILRVEILFNEGGVYFDARDLFSSGLALGELKPVHGFWWRPSGAGKNSNDLLASVREGVAVGNWRDFIGMAYMGLYKRKDGKFLYQHRNALHSGSFFVTEGINSRFQSTLDIAIAQLWSIVLDFLVTNGASFEDFHFPSKFYAPVKRSDLSWVVPSVFKEAPKRVKLQSRQKRKQAQRAKRQYAQQIKLANIRGGFSQWIEDTVTSLKDQAKKDSVITVLQAIEKQLYTSLYLPHEKVMINLKSILCSELASKLEEEDKSLLAKLINQIEASFSGIHSDNFFITNEDQREALAETIAANLPECSPIHFLAASLIKTSINGEVMNWEILSALAAQLVELLGSVGDKVINRKSLRTL